MIAHRILVSLFTLGLLLVEGCRDCPDYLPRTPEVSDRVVCMDLTPLSPSDRLAAESLQGLANRRHAEIFTYATYYTEWTLDFYKQHGYIREATHISGVEELLLKYKDDVRGIVVYDTACPPTINLATNIAGVCDCVIAGPDNLETVRSALDKPVLYDLREKKFTGETDTYQWYRENIFPLQRHNVLSIAPNEGSAYDIYRDYLVEFKIPVFWLPGHQDTDFDPEHEEQILDLFRETPANIPVLGFWPAGNGLARGYREFDGVKLAGKYGKYTLVNTHAGNYSWQSGVKIKHDRFRQKAPRRKKTPVYDPDKKYVALIMIESGDAPCYYQYHGLYQRQWNDPDRGKVPVSYGITPSLRMLAPAILEDLYATRTPNDFFFNAISGAGYCYPFEGYGSLTKNPDSTLTDYFSRLTARNMRRLDLDMLGLYTHSGDGWSESDRDIAEKYMFPMKGVRSILSGMHRTAYTASQAHERLPGGKTLHHTVTFWSYDDFVWDDPAYDEAAVAHMVKEIEENGDGPFIQAMFYSWHYGPRRLKKLQDKLKPLGYEFVTMKEFDDFYRQSLQ